MPITESTVLHGRLTQITINDSTPSEVFDITQIKEGVVKVNEAIEEARTETESPGIVVDEGIRSRTATVEADLSQIIQADITDITTGGIGGEIVLTTASGGANGNGRTFTMSACNSINAYLQDLKMRIVAMKQTIGSALGYVLADVI